MKDMIKFGIIASLIAGVGVVLIVQDAEPQTETVVIRQIIEKPASTTTTTTTTTLPPAPSKPSKSALLLKVEEMYPGSTNTYPAKAIEDGGAMACRMWVDGATRFSTMREINNVLKTHYIDDTNLAAVISTAVLWTICPVTKSFPNGPLEY